MLINISTDYISFSHSWSDQITTIPYDDLERTLPKEIIAYHTQHNGELIHVINGPGSFTMLRIGCLCVNLLAQTENVEIFDIPKLDLYQAAMEQWDLPAVGVVFMGQRKKVRVIEEKEESREKRKDSIWWWKRFTKLVWVNHLLDYLWDRSYRAEETVDHIAFKQIETTRIVSDMKIEEDAITAQYAWKKIQIPTTNIANRVDVLSPRYMLDPLVW